MTPEEPDTPDVGEVPELVRESLARVLALPPSRVHPRARLAGDLRADSLDLVEAVEIIERSLRRRGRPVRVPEAVLASCRTVGDLMEGVADALRRPSGDVGATAAAGGTPQPGRPAGGPHDGDGP